MSWEKISLILIHLSKGKDNRRSIGSYSLIENVAKGSEVDDR